eukprot:247965-Prorocentrum_minimum.AAC.1
MRISIHWTNQRNAIEKLRATLVTSRGTIFQSCHTGVCTPRGVWSLLKILGCLPSCTKEKGAELLNNGQNLVYMKQLGDWKIVPGPDADSVPRLRREVAAKDFTSALAIFQKIAPLAEKQGAL